MTWFPHLNSGEIGSFKHHHMNDLMRLAQEAHEKREPRETIEQVARRVNLKDSRFVVEIDLGQPQPNFPLQRWLSWDEKALAAATGPGGVIDWSVFLGRTSFDDQQIDPFAHPAFILTPPMGLMTAVNSAEGTKRYAYQPATSALWVRIDAVHNGQNATYRVISKDDAYFADDLTPMDRWETINYQPKEVGDTALLLIEDDETMHLVAFEAPEFAACPAQLVGTGAIVELQSILGI